jgi:hypothetical protein
MMRLLLHGRAKAPCRTEHAESPRRKDLAHKPTVSVMCGCGIIRFLDTNHVARGTSTEALGHPLSDLGR